MVNADEDDELADESGEAGKPSAASAAMQNAPVSRGFVQPKPPSLPSATRLLAILDVAEHEEERRAEEPVRDDVDERALERERIERRDREDHQPEMRERRVRDDELDVGLNERDERAVEQRDDREDDEYRRLGR